MKVDIILTQTQSPMNAEYALYEYHFGIQNEVHEDVIDHMNDIHE